MRIGVIGTGSMGVNHVRIYKELGLLHGITDVNESYGKTIADKYSTSFFSTAEKLIKDVDAVSISTPTSTHFDMVKLAIENGVDVLVEKPFTGDLKKAESLCRLAEKEGAVLGVGMVERFNPVVAAVKSKLSSEDYGNLLTFSSRRVSSMPERIRDVGVIMDLGIHDVDVFSYLCDAPVKSVYAIGGSANGTGFEDHANILLEAEDGVKGIIEVNWLTPMKVRSVSLTCSKLFAQFDYMDQSITTSSSKYSETSNVGSSFESPWEFDQRKLSLKRDEPLKRELQGFVDSVQKRTKPLVDGFDALNDLQICMGALESIREGRRISLS